MRRAEYCFLGIVCYCILNRAAKGPGLFAVNNEGMHGACLLARSEADWRAGWSWMCEDKYCTELLSVVWFGLLTRNPNLSERIENDIQHAQSRCVCRL